MSVALTVPELVHQKFLGGWIACAFMISLLGAFTTLVALRERTSARGFRNWLLLTGAALAMGGISIFSMHFIGNRAVILVDQDKQLHYGGGVVAASFILPVVIVFLAFAVVGASETGSGMWPTLLLGGTLAGCGVVGMHYCGQAAITNYQVSFRPAFVAASVIIAVTATNFALALFFVLRSHWADSWPRLAGCAVILAGAVTSMHFTAACGTVYHTKHSDRQHEHVRENVLIIVVLVISIVTCIALLSYTAYIIKRAADRRARSRKVVLACAVFDPAGNIMVYGSDGTLPAQTITDTYIDFSVADTFDSSNTAFQWMYKVSMNWYLIIPMMNQIRSHLAATNESAPLQDLSRQAFSIRLRELFCTAAQALADQTGTSLCDIGVCYDKIVKTGGSQYQGPLKRLSRDFELGVGLEEASPQSPEKQGRTIVLVKHISTQESEHYMSRGFRFAQIGSVATNIASALDLSRDEASAEICRIMHYEPSGVGWAPGLHIACFGVRAQVLGGFSVLVESLNRQFLPSARVQEEPLDEEALEFLSRHYGLTFRELALSCAMAANQAHQEAKIGSTLFYARMHNAIQSLTTRLADGTFEEARFIPTVAKIPCRGQYKGATARLLLFRFSVPIHVNRICPDLEWIPFSMFNTSQLINSDEGVNAFTRDLYHEFGPLFQQLENDKTLSGSPRSGAEKGSFSGIMVQQDNEIRVDDAEDIPKVPLHADQLNQGQYKAAFLATGGHMNVGTWSEQALRLDNGGWRF